MVHPSKKFKKKFIKIDLVSVNIKGKKRFCRRAL